MKTFYFVTKSQEILEKEFFLPSVKKDSNIETYRFFYDENNNCGDGSFRTDQYLDTLIYRNKKIIEIIEYNLNTTICISDIDIYFFKPFSSECLNLINGYDILHMRDGIHLLQPNGGFTILKCNEKTLNFYKFILNKVINSDNRFYLDQDAMLDYYNNQNIYDLKHNYLDERFATMPNYSYWNHEFQKKCICVHAVNSSTVKEKVDKLNFLVQTYLN